MFESIIKDGYAGAKEILICLGAAFITGLVFAFLSAWKTESSRSFLIGTMFLPLTAALIIFLVNGSIGTGIAIAGAFGLVKFRSAQGSAREIAIVFIAVAGGLAFGTGYIGYGVLFLLFCGALLFAFERFGIFKDKKEDAVRCLKITVPEGLNYDGAFDDVFKEYTSSCSLVQARTANMGSMYRLTYRISLKDETRTKEMIDALRCRNGNLEISVELPEMRTENVL